MKLKCLIALRVDKTALLLLMATWCFDVIKNCLTLIAFKRSANTVKCEHFFELQQMLMLIMSFHVLRQLISKIREALFCGKFSRVFSSATSNTETVSGFGWSFQKASCIAAQTWYLQRVQMWRVRWPLSLLNNLQTVRVQALLSDTCCVRRVPCISYAPPSGYSRLQFSINFESIN